MRPTLLIVAVGIIAGAFAGMVFHTHALSPVRHPAPNEKWVDANHLKVLSRGNWQDVELMPLADHLCHGRQPMFQRYCADPS